MLKKRIEFLRTYKTKPVLGKFFKIYTMSNELSSNRLGVTIPKAVGNAVTRNKYKRWSKAVFKDYQKVTKTPGKFKDVHVFFTSSKKDTKPAVVWQEFKQELSHKLREMLGTVD